MYYQVEKKTLKHIPGSLVVEADGRTDRQIEGRTGMKMAVVPEVTVSTTLGGGGGGGGGLACWFSVLVLAVVMVLTVPQVVVASGARDDTIVSSATRGAADGQADESKLTPYDPHLGLTDLKDLDPPEPKNSPLSPSSLRSSILYQMLHSQAALRRRQEALRQGNPDDAENNDDDFNDEGDNKLNKVSNSDNADDELLSDAVKRVFCNGFTGCGGRHRQVSRRRRILGKRLIPVLVKRRFCTSFGCFRTKASSAEEFPLTRFIPKTLSRRVTTVSAAHAKDPEKVQEEENEEEEEESRKRLFCNQYGGCRGGGGGKRTLFSPWMSKMNSVADSGR